MDNAPVSPMISKIKRQFITFLKKRQSLLVKLTLGFSIMAGALIRLWSISMQGSFVFDELVTVEGSRTISALAQTISFDNLPPLYSFFSFLWLKSFSVTEFNVRVLPVIFSIGTVILVYPLARKLHPDPWFAATATLFVGFSPWLVYYAAFARHYSLFSLLSVWFVYEIIRFSPQKNAGRLITSAWLLSLTHPFGAFTVFLTTLTLFFLSPQKLKTRYLKILFASHLFFLLWLLIQLPHRLEPDTTQTWFELSRSYPSLFVQFFLLPFTVLDSNPITIMLLLVVLGLFSKIPATIKKNYQVFMLLVATVSGPLLASAASLNVVRYVVGALPLMIVLTLTVVWHDIAAVKARLALLCFLLVNMLVSLTALAGASKPCFDKVVQKLPENQVVFVAHPARVINYKYYAGDPTTIRPLEGNYPMRTYADRIEYNYRQQYSEKSQKKLVKQLDPYKSFVLITTKEIFPQDEILLPVIHRLGFRTEKEIFYDCLPKVTERYFKR